MVHYNKIRQQEREETTASCIVYTVIISLFVSRELWCAAAAATAAIATITCAKNRDLCQSRVIIDANSLLCETVKLDNDQRQQQQQRPTTHIAVVPAPKHTQMVSIQLIYLRITAK